MQRTAMKKLVEWKNKRNRKPLILRGARQVGKTWLMKEFGRSCFQNVAYINFDSDARMRHIFDEDYDVARILRMINIETGIRMEPEKTLILFDEVQEAPKAISSLKYFCENAPEYAVIAAGSLLGVAIHSGVSFPVGKVETMDMYPMSFHEFLEAMGEAALAELLSEKGILNRESPELGDNQYQFYVSDGAEKFKRFANSIIKYGILSTKTVNIEQY